MSELSLQVSFQGGGAKIIDLMAAAEALQQTDIRLSCVAGTSAGSIVAALLACDVKISSIDSAQISPVLSHFTDSDRLKELGSESFWQKAGQLLDIFYGKPIVEENLVHRAIVELLKAVDIDPDIPVRDVPKPIFIAASSLIEAKAIYFSQLEEKLSMTKLSDALTYSCSIPFLFTGFSGQMDWRQACVDGGLSENLPVEPLIKQADKSGPVVAFSVTPDQGTWPPSNAKQYLANLFDVAINNSVERSRRLLGQENVYMISSSLRTYDLSRVQPNFRLSAGYKRTRTGALDWIRSRAKALTSAGTVATVPVASETLVSATPSVGELLEQNGKALAARMAGKSYRIECSALIAKPFSFKRNYEKDTRKHRPSDLLVRAHIIPRQEGFRLQEYPIGNASLGSNTSAPTVLHVDYILKNGERKPAEYHMFQFSKSADVFGQVRPMTKCGLTFTRALPSAEDDIEDLDPNKILIWYEEEVDCLFDDMDKGDDQYDTLGLSAGGLLPIVIDSVYLIICEDCERAGVQIAQDEKSVPLQQVKQWQLPNELAFLTEANLPFHGWKAIHVAHGSGARLRLTRAR